METFRCRRVCTPFTPDQCLRGLDKCSSLGGMCGAIVTSPFDVVKTRLQSSLFREGHATLGLMTNGSGGALLHGPRHGGLLWNFVETGHILRWVCLIYAPQSSNSFLQWHLPRWISPRAIQRSWADANWCHSSTFNQFLYLWQWKSCHCQCIQWWPWKLFCSSFCSGACWYRHRDGHQPYMGCQNSNATIRIPASWRHLIGTPEWYRWKLVMHSKDLPRGGNQRVLQGVDRELSWSDRRDDPVGAIRETEENDCKFRKKRRFSRVARYAWQCGNCQVCCESSFISSWG